MERQYINWPARSVDPLLDGAGTSGNGSGWANSAGHQYDRALRGELVRRAGVYRAGEATCFDPAFAHYVDRTRGTGSAGGGSRHRTGELLPHLPQVSAGGR